MIQLQGLCIQHLLGSESNQFFEDVERLFSQGVIDFMEKHNYESEVNYLRRVRNWRHAVDERG